MVCIEWWIFNRFLLKQNPIFNTNPVQQVFFIAWWIMSEKKTDISTKKKSPKKISLKKSLHKLYHQQNKGRTRRPAKKLPLKKLGVGHLPSKKTGVMILPTQTIHSERKIPQNDHACVFFVSSFDFPQIWLIQFLRIQGKDLPGIG